MSAFIRFLSRRRSGRGLKKSRPQRPEDSVQQLATKNDTGKKQKPPKHCIAVTVMLLDGTDMSMNIHVSNDTSLLNITSLPLTYY